MRYALYSYIDGMMETLVEAAEFIVNSDNRELCLHLLSDCNHVLDKIKSTLLENEDSPEISSLFDSISSCSDNLNNLVMIGGTSPKGSSDFLESIKNMRSSYRDNIKVIYQVVFFAELGQKWDSMNSVYRAFMKRNDCEVKVVLTPIFRAVQSNGKLETDIIYEDYLTPMGIDFIPYNQYDITKDLPDFVFISNPYESVTLPQFWPENLSQYTRVVYLPYYTGMLINPESIKVHCGLPVAKYAWKIIAQSQKILDIHKNYAPKKGENILVTGLPKWDDFYLNDNKVLENKSIWDEKLSGKNVFLWNSHYNINSETSTLLEYGKSIMQFFQNRKDIGLIWRPHPMTETIFKLYMPQLLPLWEELNETVKNADNMIFDTTTSYKWAFQYSNALISDWSSILTQYLFSQKPMLWLRKDGALEDISTSEKLIHVECLEQAYDPNDINNFIERVKSGIDLSKNDRLRILQEDLQGADGNIGERVCSLLLKEFQEEIKPL